MTDIHVDRFLDRLSSVRRSGTGWSASCPCREDDRNPSLTVGVGAEGQVLVNCHRGTPCSLDEICDSVGVKPEQLWPDDDTPWTPPPPAHKPAPAPIKKKDAVTSIGDLEKTYDYVDADGELVMQVLRYRQNNGAKTFRQRCPDSHGKWLWSTQHLTDRPLYRLPEVLAARDSGQPVWIVEGEKDADNLSALGYTATCNPMGADNGTGNKWRPEHTAALAGARVWVIADNDTAGFLHARYVTDQLTEAGAKVRLRTVPAPHKDMTDFLEAGGNPEDAVELDENGVSAGETAPEIVVTYEEPPVDSSDRISRLRAMLDDVLGDTKMDETRRITKAQRLMDEITAVTPRRESLGRITTWQELTSEADQGYDWLIPGVLERGERVMIVAAEGVGKTMLARQIAIACAAGTHPFTMTRIDPVRTLFVDLENPERIIRRTARKIVENVEATWPGRDHEEARLWIKPDGINVLNARDRDRLEEVIEDAKPDLLVMGPIYKMFVDPGGRSSEAVTIEVATYLDRLRTIYGVALWLEHHAPLGNSLSGRDLRPMGSAVWMRWPEFGYALSPDPTAHKPEYEVKQWRGPRDDRAWPARLRRGTILPFEVVT